MLKNSLRARITLVIAAMMPHLSGGDAAHAAAPPTADLPPGAIARLGTIRFRQGGGVNCLDLSRDGKRLLTLGWGYVRVWDTASGRELYRHEARHEGAEGGALSPDGKTAVIDGGEAGHALVDLASGKIVRSLPLQHVTTVAFGPDAKTFATAAVSGTTLWDAATLTPITRLETIAPHPDGLPRAALSYSGNGRLLAWIHGQKVGLHDLRAGKANHRFIDTSRHVRALALTPDGKLLASASDDKTVQVWDVASGKAVRLLVGHGAIVRRIIFSPDGTLVATSSNGPRTWAHLELHALRLWDTATGKEVAKLGRYSNGTLAGRFSPDGKLLYSGGSDCVRVWDVTTKTEIFQGVGHQGYVDAIAYSPDGRTLATAGSDMTVHLWDTATKKVLRRFMGCETKVGSLAFSPDVTRLAAGCWNAHFVVWDTSNGTLIARAQVGQPHHQAVVAFSPDGKLLATGCNDGQISLWHPTGVKEIRRIPPARQDVTSLTFSPDSKHLAAGGLSRERGSGPEPDMVRLYDVATCKEVRRYAGFAQSAMPVRSVCFSPNGRLITGNANTIELWDVATTRRVRQIRPGPLGSKIAFSPDGRTLASADDTGLVRLWEVSTGAERRRWTGHVGWVYAVAFSPDGRTLATGGVDTTVLLWDVRAPRAMAKATPAEYWQALADRDADKAYEAILALAASSTTTVPLLRGQLAPAPEQGAAIQQLLADLDNDDFATREKASKALTELGAVVEPALRKAQETSPSPELRRRAQRILETLRDQPFTTEELRQLRAVEALEYCGTADAIKLLDTLSRGADEARQTQEAKAALARLTRRPGK